MSDVTDNNWSMTEIRPVRMPDGSMRAVVATKLHWSYLDEELVPWQVTPEEIAAHALDDARETGRDFDKLFCDYITAAYTATRPEAARIDRELAAERRQ